MNANEIADELDGRLDHQAANMLRQQQAEIEALKKESALQRLSDFTQEAELLNTRSYLLGRYDSSKTLTDEEIKQVWQANLVAMGNDLDFAKAILKKASEK